MPGPAGVRKGRFTSRLRGRGPGALALRGGVAVLLLATAACGAPIGAHRVGPEKVHRMLTSSALSTGKPSGFTANVLYQRDLYERFQKAPGDALAELRRLVVEEDHWGRELLALAELSFLHAERSGDRSHHLACAVYAYAYLFAPAEDGTSRFDPGTRLAADLYNRAVTEAFKTADGKRVDFEERSYALPFGALEVEVERSGFVWARRELYDLVPAAELEVTGMRTRHRQPGLGAPLVAATRRIDPKRFDIVARRARVPATALLIVEDAREVVRTGAGSARVELFPGYRDPTVEVAGETVPLEIESTASLAFALSQSPIWRRELRGLLGLAEDEIETPQLASLEPYRPGLIPVVFVHGTASSPGRWAQMVNDLLADERIHDRYFFVFFMYDTGNPILYSAMLLRDMVDDALRALDADGAEACLRETVVIGHSQGGLLTKLTAVESGDRFWRYLSDAPFEELELRPESRDLLRRALFVEPLPWVRRLVFIATPHHGSFVAGRGLSRRLAGFITLPFELIGAVGDLVASLGEDSDLARLGRTPTSIEAMAPGSPFLETLAEVPVVEGVASHSIIAVEGEGPLQEASDGVVEYVSAHVPYTVSEFVVRSGHSTQSNPHTIKEVRRILLEHAAGSSCAGEEGPS